MISRKVTMLGLALLVVGAAMTAAAPVLASPEFKVRGRMHLDTALWDEDSVPLNDSSFFRRVRIGLTGKIDDHWSGTIEYDFAENVTAANEVVLRRSLGGGTLKIGHFKVPKGLNELTSSNNMTFIERASNNNSFSDSRRIGLGYDWASGDVLVQTMLFTRAIGSSQGGEAPMGVAGRLVWAPKVGDGRLHLGASVAFEDRNDETTVRYRDRPEARPGGGVRLIDTGSIGDVDDTFKFGLELAYQAGPFSVEAEYLGVDVNRSAGAEPTFSGYHVQASYVLTGESRGYRGGAFRGNTPATPRGAWEVGARFSSVDLIDAGFTGGEQENFTLGLNYYAGANVRFMVNYIFIDVKGSTAVANGVTVGSDNPNVLLARAQYHF